MFVRSSYFIVFIFFILSFFLAVFALIMPVFIGPSSWNSNKKNNYECGIRNKVGRYLHFSATFYLVAVLFIVFDIEIALIIPWSLSIGYIGLDGFYLMCIFSLFLVVGFVYEIMNGVIDL